MSKSSKKNLPVEVAQNELYDIVTKLIDYLGDNLPDSKTLAEKILAVSNDITQLLVNKPSSAVSFISEKITSLISDFIKFKNSELYNKAELTDREVAYCLKSSEYREDKLFEYVKILSSSLISHINQKYRFQQSPDSLVYQEIKNLLEFVVYPCHDARDLTPKIDDKLISLLMPQYNDIEALNAFYRLFVKPIVGTKRAIQSIFDIVGEEGKPIEWFENGLTPFHYAIEYDRIPEDIDIDRIIELAEWLKNERSHLLTIRTPLCGYPLRWDYTRWDKDQWDNIEGVKWKDTNVYVCFSTRDGGFDYFNLNPYQMTTFMNCQSPNYIFNDYHNYDEFFWDFLRRGEFVRQYIDYDFINKSRWSRPAITFPYYDKVNGIWIPRIYTDKYDFKDRNLPLRELPIVNHDFFLSPNNNQEILIGSLENTYHMYTRFYCQHWNGPASLTRPEFYKVFENGEWITKSRQIWNADDFLALEWDKFNWDKTTWDDSIYSKIRDRLLLTQITNVYLISYMRIGDNPYTPKIISDESLAYISAHIYRKNPLISFYKDDELVRKEIHFDISSPLVEWSRWLGGNVDYFSNTCGIAECGINCVGLVPLRDDLPLETITTPYQQLYDDYTAIYEDNVCGVARAGTGVTGFLSPNVSPNTNLIPYDDYSVWEPVPTDSIKWDLKNWDDAGLIEVYHQTDFLADNPVIHYLYYNLNKNEYTYYNLEDKDYSPFENTMYTLNYGYGSLYTLHPEFERPSIPVMDVPSPEDSEGYSEPDEESDDIFESNEESEGYEPSLDSYAEPTIWDNKLWGENFYDGEIEIDWDAVLDDELHDPESPYYDPRTELEEVEVTGDIVSPHPVGYYTKRKALSSKYTYSISDIENTYSPFLDLDIWNLSDSEISSDKSLITDTISVNPDDVRRILPLKFQKFTWDYIFFSKMDGIKDIHSFYTLSILDHVNYRANDGHSVEYTCHTLDFLNNIKYEISLIDEYNNVSSSSVPSVIRYPNTYEFIDGDFREVEKDYPLTYQNYALFTSQGQIIDISPYGYTNHSIDFSSLISENNLIHQYVIGVLNISDKTDFGIYREIDIDSSQYQNMDIEESMDIELQEKVLPPVVYQYIEIKVIENSALIGDNSFVPWNLYETSGAVQFYSSIAEHRRYSQYEIDIDSLSQPFRLDDPRYANLDMDSFVYDIDLNDETQDDEYSIIYSSLPDVIHVDLRSSYEESDTLEDSEGLDISDLGNEFESNEYSLGDYDISLGEVDDSDDVYGEYEPYIDMETITVPWDVDYGYIDVDQSQTYMLIVDGVYSYVYRDNETPQGNVIPSPLSVYQSIKYIAA